MTPAQLEAACEKAITHLQEEFSRLQLGRASTGLVENIDIFITAQGSTSKINRVASVNLLDAQTIKIEPREKSTTKDIERGITESWLWFMPLNQGDYILIKVPPLTQERRIELTKFTKTKGEETKVAIRQHRQDARKHVEKEFKDKVISENDKGATENRIDDIVKKYTDMVDTVVETKNQDIMKV